MSFELGTFGTDGGIDIPYPIPLFCYQANGLAQEDLTVDVQKFLTVVWEMITDVTHICRTQKSVADSMNEDISITVPPKTLAMFNSNAT